MNAKLKFANFINANLQGTNLQGANLDRAYYLSCEQIKSAVVDINTRFPDYIVLAGSHASTDDCMEVLKKN